MLNLVVQEERVLTSQELLGPSGLVIAVDQLKHPEVPSATMVLAEPDYAVLEQIAGLLDEGRLRDEMRRCDLIARGIFTSTSDLNSKLMRYIREYNKTATPINWKYTDVTLGIRAPRSAVTDH